MNLTIIILSSWVGVALALLKMWRDKQKTPDAILFPVTNDPVVAADSPKTQRHPDAITLCCHTPVLSWREDLEKKFGEQPLRLMHIQAITHELCPEKNKKHWQDQVLVEQAWRAWKEIEVTTHNIGIETVQGFRKAIADNMPEAIAEDEQQLIANRDRSFCMPGYSIWDERDCVFDKFGMIKLCLEKHFEKERRRRRELENPSARLTLQNLEDVFNNFVPSANQAIKLHISNKQKLLENVLYELAQMDVWTIGELSPILRKYMPAAIEYDKKASHNTGKEHTYNGFGMARYCMVAHQKENSNPPLSLEQLKYLVNLHCPSPNREFTVRRFGNKIDDLWNELLHQINGCGIASFAVLNHVLREYMPKAADAEKRNMVGSVIPYDNAPLDRIQMTRLCLKLRRETTTPKKLVVPEICKTTKLDVENIKLLARRKCPAPLFHKDDPRWCAIDEDGDWKELIDNLCRRGITTYVSLDNIVDSHISEARRVNEEKVYQVNCIGLIGMCVEIHEKNRKQRQGCALNGVNLAALANELFPKKNTEVAISETASGVEAHWAQLADVARGPSFKISTVGQMRELIVRFLPQAIEEDTITTKAWPYSAAGMLRLCLEGYAVELREKEREARQNADLTIEELHAQCNKHIPLGNRSIANICRAGQTVDDLWREILDELKRDNIKTAGDLEHLFVRFMPLAIWEDQKTVKDKKAGHAGHHYNRFGMIRSCLIEHGKEEDHLQLWDLKKLAAAVFPKSFVIEDGIYLAEWQKILDDAHNNNIGTIKKMHDVLLIEKSRNDSLAFNLYGITRNALDNHIKQIKHTKRMLGAKP